MLLILGSLTSVCYWIYNTATDWYDLVFFFCFLLLNQSQ